MTYTPKHIDLADHEQRTEENVADAAVGSWVCDECGDDLATEYSPCQCDPSATMFWEATRERDELRSALSGLLDAFPRLGHGFSTAQQQEALRRARAAVKGGNDEHE